MIDSLIGEIQDKNIPVSTLLMKAKILASKLNDKEFLEWLSQELNGYKEGDVYPKYRKITGKVKFWNPVHGWCPIVFSNPEAEKYRSSRNPRQSISEIEELLRKESSEFEMPFPDSDALEIMRDSGLQTKVILSIGSASLVGILNSVRNLLLDWVLKLEKEKVLIPDNQKEISTLRESTKFSPILTTEGKNGYLKFYKQGPKISIGKITSKKYKLLELLTDPLGTARTIDSIFEVIKTSKDELDSKLKDEYLARGRKIELIQFIVKELQKIKGLKGKITIEIHHSGNTALLKLIP